MFGRLLDVLDYAVIATSDPRIFANLGRECQNGRMVMTPEVLSNETQIQQLHVAEVVRYLQQNCWTALQYPNPRFLVFEKGVDDQGKPIQIVLPSKDEYEDRPYLLAKAVNLLSVLESVSLREILNEMNVV
jgi:hypothetical protein